MYFRKTTLMLALLTALSSLSALAHEGHGHPTGQGNTPTHYLTEPLHLFQFAAIAVVVFAVGWVTLKWLLKSPGNTVKIN